MATFGKPVLNDSGQVAFQSLVAGTTEGPTHKQPGIFRGDINSLTEIARQGQLAPDGNGRLLNLSDPSTLNNSGQVAFGSSLTGTSGGSTDNGASLRGDGTILKQMVRKGQAAPDGNGTFQTSAPSFDLSDAGELAFSGHLVGTSGGNSDDDIVFLSNGTELTQIAREGQMAPDGNGNLAGFGQPALNVSGQAAFLTYFTVPGDSRKLDKGILRGNGVTLTQIVRDGQIAPDGNGSILDVGNRVLLNDLGQAVFPSTLGGTSFGLLDDSGIFLGDGTMLTQIAREGQSAPDGDGSFSSLGAFFSINNAGQVAFLADLRNSSHSPSIDRGIFRSDGTTLTQIVRSGQAAPDGIGTVTNFNNLVLNEVGQIVFSGNLVDANGDSHRSIYFYDDLLGLQTVVSQGDAFLNSTISSFGDYFSPSFPEGLTALNNLGQVAIQFRLADGRSGIALWSIPEPSSAVLVTLSGVLFLCRRQNG